MELLNGSITRNMENITNLMCNAVHHITKAIMFEAGKNTISSDTEYELFKMYMRPVVRRKMEGDIYTAYYFIMKRHLAQYLYLRKERNGR